MTGDVEKPLKRVFIVGFPRSGTTWTMWLLAQLPGVVALQQSGLFHALDEFEEWWNTDHPFSRDEDAAGSRDEDAGVAAGNGRSEGGGGALATKPDETRLRNTWKKPKWTKPVRAGGQTFYGSTSVLDEHAYFELCRPILTHVFDSVASATPGTRVVVEQTPENLEFERTIRHVFPDAYFLHVLRDPRDSLCSMRRAARGWDNEFPGRPIHIAKRWMEYRDRAKSLEENAQHYYEIRYEDLKAEGAPALLKIARWIGIDVDEAACAAAVEACEFERMRGQAPMPKAFFRRGGAGGWKDELSRGELRVVEHIVGDEMERLGYARHHPRSENPPFSLKLHDFLAHHCFERVRWWSMHLTQGLRKPFVHRWKSMRYTSVHDDQ